VHILTRQEVRRTKVTDALPQYPLLALQSLGLAFIASQLGAGKGSAIFCSPTRFEG